jgi:predicted transcriptional regulator
MLDISYYIVNKKEQESVPLLKELLDKYSYKILLSIIDESKTVFQICNEINVPTSSAYKKIKKLKDSGLLFVDKIEINISGKKVFFYKSKIRSIELILNKQQFILQFRKNENTFSK